MKLKGSTKNKKKNKPNYFMQINLLISHIIMIGILDIHYSYFIYNQQNDSYTNEWTDVCGQ